MLLSNCFFTLTDPSTMEEDAGSQHLVEFSAGRIQLENNGRERQRSVYQLQNRCPSSKRVRAAIAKDSDPVFRLLSGSEEKYLAPGLKLPVVIQYSPQDAGSHQGCLEVYMENTLVHTVPIIALPPAPRLHIHTDLVQLGTLVTDHQIVTSSFSLSNHGSKVGSFFINTAPLPPWITLKPTQGYLEPEESTNIQIEVLCKKEGAFSYTLSIHSDEDSAAPLSITLTGQLQTRCLQLLDLYSHTVLQCVTFRPTYYGTRVTRRLLLHNVSPVATDYLSLLDCEAEGRETGADRNEGLSTACSEGGLGQGRWREQGNSPCPERLVRVEPSQGSLLPYEKRVIEMTFAPTFSPLHSGWGQFQAPPTCRNYVLYIQFMTVGTSKEALSSSPSLEVALTASALPVNVSLHPEPPLDFGTCPTMQTCTEQLQIHNKSDTLPLGFQCHRLPHYKTDPSTGHIPPSHTLTLTVTFQPRQMGPLDSKLLIDFLGQKENAQAKPPVVKTVAVELRGEGGVGKRKGKRGSKVVKAHPDDLATSIRPHDGTDVVTPFTHTPRYTYVDRDYAYSEEEREKYQTHRDSYLHYLRDKQREREWRRKEKTHLAAVCGAETDLGLVPMQEPESAMLSVPHVRGEKRRSRGRGERGRGGGGGGTKQKMMTTTDLLSATNMKLLEVVNCPSKPSSVEVADEITKSLSPQQLSQVTIVPAVLDYGSVAVGSSVEQTVTVRNTLNQHIRVVFKLAGSGLQCSLPAPSPSSSTIALILPPSSFTRLPLTAQQKQEGLMERSVEYTVNGTHTCNLPVKLVAVRLSLRLSTHTLTLSQPPMATPAAGLRGSVLVYNDHNIPASFQWHARDGVDTNIFYVMHPSGVIPAHSSLQCEFVCHPSHDTPDSALFRLTVEGPERVSADTDNLLTLRTELGHPVFSFKEQRVLFGAVPLSLTTKRTVHLQNTGEHHAYFQVMNPTPYPGLRVYPDSGCVPVGGATDLVLHLHPQAVDKFDTQLTVQVREGRRLRLKLVGAVEEPMVGIDRESFTFGGVYCGAKASLPFTITNKGSTRSQLTFDFSYLSDFSLALPQTSSPYAEVVSEPPSSDYPGVYTLDLPAKTSAQCQLVLCPSDVAAYDFLLPILVNGLKPSSPPPSPWPPSAKQTSKIAITQGNRDPLGSYECTPSRRVLATTLRPVLTLSHTLFSFSFPVGYLETMSEPAQHSQTTELKNVGDSPLTWSLDTAGIKRLEDGTFRLVLPSGDPLPLPPAQPGGGEVGHLDPGESFKFSVQCNPAHHGTFTADIPLLINNNHDHPYSKLTLKAEIPAGKITISTRTIVLQPVPLDITLSAQFTITVQDFPGSVDLEVAVPAMESHVCFAVSFPEGAHIADCSKSAVELPFMLEFTSSKPVTKTGHLLFSDRNTGKRAKVPFAVSADNSVFSDVQFLAQSITITSVQLNSEHVPTLNVSSPSGTVVTTSTASLGTPQVLDRPTPLSMSLTTESSYSDIFLQESVWAVCRWLSDYGWSEGKYITSPTNLCERVGHDIPKPGVKQRSSITICRGLLVDLVSHICGRLPPGIPMNPPPCTTASEKINQQYSSFTTILAFLKKQGGELWCLAPDSLLDYQDYQQWLLDTKGSSCSTLPPATSEEEFQERSRQAWTYLLLQIIKVLVFPSVTSQVPPYLRETVSKLESQSSNLYSLPERVLLAWLNHHQQQQRATVLGSDDHPYKDVVNFDVDLMDCTVLACVLTAYCPFLVNTHFTHLYSEPSTQELCSHNALVLVDALKYIGIDYDCQANDLTAPNPVYLLLLCLHLYQTLPSFSPKRTVECEGLLHTTIRQQITLENSSSKPLTYRALIRGEGASKFPIIEGTDIITVPSRKGAKVEVQYTAQHIQPSTATLLLVPTGGRGQSGTAVAFKLKGKVTGVRPQSRVQVTAALYQVRSVTVEVKSPFKQAGEFGVLLYESSDKTLLHSMSPTTKRKTTTRSLGVIQTSSLESRSDDNMTVFNPKFPKIFLEPGKPTSLYLTFVPLKMDPRHCTIVLRNSDLGEIAVSISATVRPPYPTLPQTSGTNSRIFVNHQTKTLHLNTYAGETVIENLILTSQNQSFESAMMEVCKWRMSEMELQRRTLTSSMRYAALTAAMETLGLEKKTKTVSDPIEEGLDKLVFQVDGSNEYFDLPKSVEIPAGQNGTAVLPVHFRAEEPGQYECYITLSSTHDVRVFIIESTVMAKGRFAELELCTAAMQPLTQDIPLVNPSTVDWPLQASMTGVGFSGPETIVAKALSTTCYPLTFSPKKEGQVEGELYLVNIIDGSDHTFMLKGVAEKPLAHEHIVLHAQAQKSHTHILHVPNYNERTTVFQVESDLECVSGPSTLSIGGGDLVDYPLSIRPKRRGVSSGAVAFVAQTTSKINSGARDSLCTPGPRNTKPHHVWFHIECHAEPAPPEHVISLSCATLSSTTTYLTVVNPHPQPLDLKVCVEGHGLSGPNRLEVAAEGMATYPLNFSPVLNGKSIGEVVFDGGPDGEFWYQLQLSADDPTPVSLPDAECELGSTTQVCVPLSNPLDHSVLFKCECSNTKHFIIPGLTDSQVMLDAGHSAEVPVLFKPSSLGPGEHTAHVSFTSDEFGTQVFVLKGRGLEPSTMAPITIQASLNSNSTHILTFTNPLDNATHFRVDLHGTNPSEQFCLLLKRTRGILLHPGVSLDIPVMFAPEAMHTHDITVTVSTDERKKGSHLSLAWRYPITGQPEFRPVSPSMAPRLSCRAKERLEQRLEAVLVGCKMSKAALIRPVTPSRPDPDGPTPQTPLECDSYTYQLVCLEEEEEECSGIVQDSIGVRLLRKEMENEDSAKLVFAVVFAPPKAFSCTAELRVIGGNGGVWNFPVRLLATPADPDDIIVIEAAGLNKESQVQFRLTSLQEHPLPFTAHLVHGSHPDITVFPTSGELTPINGKGTLFFITYKPQKYGHDHRAKLVVQCETNEWCYEIVGKPPQYSPPTNTPSRVQHRTTAPLVLSQTRKNFIRENMKLYTRVPVQ